MRLLKTLINKGLWLFCIRASEAATGETAGLLVIGLTPSKRLRCQGMRPHLRLKRNGPGSSFPIAFRRKSKRGRHNGDTALA